ncbi:MAG: TetR/AcrR family transcriptional regulator [Desulfotalea sp.]
MTRKEIIIKAATELFGEKGYRETTTADIRKRAGVAQGTLFYHFKSKEGIILHIFADILTDYLNEVKNFSHEGLNGLEALIKYAKLAERLRKERGENLVFILPNFVPSLIKDNEEAQQIFIQYHESTITSLEKLLVKGMKDGSIRDVEPRTTAHFLFALSIGINRHMTMPGQESSELIDICIDFIKRSLKAE